jgi:predicted phage tail protein
MNQVIGTSDVGSYGQMALNAFGRPVVCYYDYISSNPKIAEHVTLPSQATEVATARGNGMVEITWSSPEEKGGSVIGAYRIYRGLSPSNLSMVASVNGSTFTYSDLGLTNGVRVYYAVAAVNVEGQGAGSTVVSAVPATLPSAPRELKATAGSASVQLSWLAPASDGGSPITHYRVWRGSNATVLSFLGNSTGTSYIDSSVENGKTYYYHVTAVNDVGEGANSTTVSASPTADDTLLLVGVVALVVLVAAAAVYVFMRRR